MEKQKPTFEEVSCSEAATTWVRINQRSYTARLLGTQETNWHQLISSSLENPYFKVPARIGTLEEALTFLHAAVVNDNYIAFSLKRNIVGNTALYGGDKDSDFVFAQDMPEIIDSRIIMNQKSLESKLGHHKVGEVIFSDDGLVRAMPRNELPNEMDCVYFSNGKVDYPILITGDKEFPKKIAEIIESPTIQKFLDPVEEIKNLLGRLIPIIDYGNSIEDVKKALEHFRRESREKKVYFDAIIPQEQVVIPSVQVNRYNLYFYNYMETHKNLYSFSAPETK